MVGPVPTEVGQSSKPMDNKTKEQYDVFYLHATKLVVRRFPYKSGSVHYS